MSLTSRRRIFLKLSLACAFCASPLASLPVRAADVAGAERITGSDGAAVQALLEGRVEEAQALLRTALAEDASNASAHQLLCRVFYSQEQADPAIHECELAVVGIPATQSVRASNAHLWLGRAYGLKARHAGPLAGFSLARRVHTAFEAAVQLNPSNVDALSDLGQYYVDAPSIVGGGDDKARALAARMMPRFAPDAHRILGMLAQSNKDFATAESEFKLAISSARASEGHTLAEAQSGGWIDLARFYQTQNRPDEAASAVHSAIALDRTIPAERAHGPLLVEAASILAAVHREPTTAERCLRDYLAGHARSDAAPAFKVHLQLARLLAARGLSDQADREVATAQALAPSFRSHRSTEGS